MADHILKDIVERKWQIVLFTVIAAAVAFGISIALPEQYLSQASLLPANSKLMDKQRLYEDNIQELYSAYGSADDLDRLFATMHSGAVIHQVADSLKLAEHYELAGRKNGKTLAQKKLEKNIKLIRTEYGELQLRVWDKDPAKAEQIAAALVSRTQDVFDGMFRSFYDRSLASLRSELSTQKSTGDTLQVSAGRLRVAGLEQRIAEYEITRLNPPAAFFVMEKPSVSTIADRPKILLITWIAARRAMIS